MGKTLNGNVMCSIGIRTTGKDPKTDEIYHICILPLDLNYNPIFKQIFEKYIRVSPEHEKKLKLQDRIFAKRHTEVWDLFDEWFDLHIKKGQIIPLVYDWPVTKEFLTSFVSESGFKLAFCDKARDLKAVSLYMNDLHEGEDKVIPFSKTTLRYILNNCEAPLDLKYTALQQAMAMSKAYKRMLRFPF
jgi:hypothetical protein